MTCLNFTFETFAHVPCIVKFVDAKEMYPLNDHCSQTNFLLWQLGPFLYITLSLPLSSVPIGQRFPSSSVSGHSGLLDESP